MGFVTGDAPTAPELSQCVQCGLCLPHCPTFRLTGRESASPRGRLSAMSAVLDGVMEVDEFFDEAISFCLGCRACEAVCPGLVPYGRVFEGARHELAVQRPTRERRVRRWALGRLLPSRIVVRIATFGLWVVTKFGLSRLVPGRLRGPVEGARADALRHRTWVGRGEGEGDRGTVALLAGCVMDAWFGPVHDATVAVLTAAGYRVEVPAEQTCCGALAAHDGHAGDARRLAATNVDVFAGYDLVVSDAAGCTAHLKEYRHWATAGDEMETRVRDVTELVASLIDDGVLPKASALTGRAAVQDPCHLRHAQRITVAPRTILAAAGLRPVEIDPDGLCCGAAGIYGVLNPEAGTELGRRKADQVRAVEVDLVASANPGCEMQLRSHLGPTIRVAHPIELYAEWLKDAERPT